ncbi:MAG: DNA recombination protein RmuC [Bacteroidales bacterium]|nr:DNA recombination protein RmuC [Bacteroidales bacterium]
MDILYLFIGFISASLISWLIFKAKSAGVTQENVLLQKQLGDIKNELRQKDDSLFALNAQLSVKDTELKNQDTRLQEQKKEMIEIREKLNSEFRNLANEILEEKSKKFTEQNKTNLDQLLKPLGERIKEFEKKVDETYDKEAQQRFSLKEEVKRLAELNQQISKDANSLTKALKGDSKTQGDWGEVILESILERTGLRKGYEYTVQDSFSGEENKRYQSDVIVHYPGERSIIIDSKVSLTAYEKYISAENEAERKEALKAHLVSVKNHISILDQKKYQDIEEIKTLDFIIMFMPVEPAYLLAIQHEPQLWNYAYEKRILLISPTNLVAVLKMIESLWKQEFQNRNVIEIAQQGGALYDSFVLLSENLIKLGKKIDEASVTYKDSMKKISEGKGNLVSRVEKLKKLGVKAKKNLPESLLNRALENDDTTEVNE